MDAEEQLDAELDTTIRSSPAFDKELAESYENMRRCTGDPKEKFMQLYLFWAILFPQEARDDLIDRWKSE